MRCATASASTPRRVLQTAYEPMQYDETGALCGSQPTLGIDVNPKLKLGRDRIPRPRYSSRARSTPARMHHRTSRRRRLPGRSRHRAGTGFKLVAEHHTAVRQARHVRAQSRSAQQLDGTMMAMPRRCRGRARLQALLPGQRASLRPCWRLFRSPNDAFLTANTHREGISLFDIIQPAYAALYSGAVHPTAEGHAIVADHVMVHARNVVDKRNIEVTPATTGLR